MDSKRDTLASGVVGACGRFREALSRRGPWPWKEFEKFSDLVMAYAALTAKDELVHRSVVSCVNGLREFLQLERRRAPGEALAMADRMEVMLFSGYDPYFEGDEPPDPDAINEDGER